MKHYFVLFKKRNGENGNSYSLVNEVILKSIQKDIIQAKKEVPDKIYTKEELKSFVEALGGEWYVAS